MHSLQPAAPVPAQWLKIQADNCSRTDWFSYPNHTAFLYSPGYPKPYPADFHCTFIVQLQSSNQRMEFSFEEVGLETDHDWVKITSGFDQKIITGSRLPTPFTTTSHQARVVFHRCVILIQSLDTFGRLVYSWG